MDDEALLGLGELWHYVGKKMGKGEDSCQRTGHLPCSGSQTNLDSFL